MPGTERGGGLQNAALQSRGDHDQEVAEPVKLLFLFKAIICLI